MKRLGLVVFIILFVFALSAKEYAVQSPNQKITVKVTVDESVSYSVWLNEKELISPSTISLSINNGEVWGQNDKVKKAKTISVAEEIIPVVQRKYAKIPDEYNQLNLTFNEFALNFRVYNDGAAYRWVSNKEGDYKIMSELSMFAFPANHKIWFPEEESMFTHQERLYENVSLSDVTPERFCSTGMLVDCGNGVKTYISESDLTDYAGMFLQGCEKNKNALVGKFPGVVLEEKKLNDRDVKPTKYADYIAVCNGPRTFPWRAMLIAENDADLVQSELIFKLAPSLKIENTEWIKPGKVAWDWWNANNIYGVDFKSGVNNETYKYYIDFASKYGLEYIILDEGWYHLDDIMHVVDEINIPELVTYGKQKNVDIILWVVWKAVEEKLTESLDQFAKWGVKGIKMDFMQRDDQWMVNFYEKIADECAKRELLVDYHGAYKPAGLNRAYPNVISFEGVKGLENAKWSNQPDPEHNTTLPFIRMVAGPMDFTPGAMKNATKQNFKDVFTEPMSPGTRCHQLGMYVVFESPLQMLADNPSNYYREPECMQFLSNVPSVWDDTKVLNAKVSDYICMARRAGDNWYVGAMTDWNARTLYFNADFLGEGEYTMNVWKDGINADKHAADFAKETITITKASKIEVNMAPGGGWVAIISKKQ